MVFVIMTDQLCSQRNGCVIIDNSSRRDAERTDQTGQGKKSPRSFARADPYVTNQLVARWHVREWSTVVGETAASPVRPGDL